jgi:hypothetical protein
MAIAAGRVLAVGRRGFTPRDHNATMQIECWQDVVHILGSGVAAWACRITGRHYKHATVSVQPAYVAADSAFANTPILQYNSASAQKLEGPFVQGQPATYYLIGQVTASGNKGFLGTGAGGTGAQSIAALGASSRPGMYAGTVLQATTGNLLSPCLSIYEFNGSNSKIWLTDTVIPIVTGNAGASTHQVAAIGGDLTSVGYLTGKIAALVCVPAVTTAAERALMAKYLCTPRGIAYS